MPQRVVPRTRDRRSATTVVQHRPRDRDASGREGRAVGAHDSITPQMCLWDRRGNSQRDHDRDGGDACGGSVRVRGLISSRTNASWRPGATRVSGGADLMRRFSNPTSMAGLCSLSQTCHCCSFTRRSRVDAIRLSVHASIRLGIAEDLRPTRGTDTSTAPLTRTERRAAISRYRALSGTSGERRLTCGWGP